MHFFVHSSAPALAPLTPHFDSLTQPFTVWASLACHSVARAGDQLVYAEMVTLLERLQRCANPMHCPHGRPTIVRLEPDALARLFKRV